MIFPERGDIVMIEIGKKYCFANQPALMGMVIPREVKKIRHPRILQIIRY